MVQTVNRANAQARLSGILFASANGKLCFVLQTTFLQHKTTCPRTGEGRAPKSHVHELKIENGELKIMNSFTLCS